MGGLHGVKETKEIVDFGHAVGTMVDGALADGKVGLDDVGLVLGPISKAPAAFSGIDISGKELLELDQEDQESLLDHVRAQGYNDELAGVIVKESLALAVSAARIASAVKKHKAEKAAAASGPVA